MYCSYLLSDSVPLILFLTSSLLYLIFQPISVSVVPAICASESFLYLDSSTSASCPFKYQIHSSDWLSCVHIEANIPNSGPLATQKAINTLADERWDNFLKTLIHFYLISTFYISKDESVFPSQICLDPFMDTHIHSHTHIHTYGPLPTIHM